MIAKPPPAMPPTAVGGIPGSAARTSPVTIVVPPVADSTYRTPV